MENESKITDETAITSNGVLGDVETKKVQFKTLKVGDKFECYGDIHINYNYPKICKCVKTDYDTAEEIDGISFYMDGADDVFINIA
jgi:hypothetical protein